MLTIIQLIRQRMLAIKEQLIRNTRFRILLYYSVIHITTMDVIRDKSFHIYISILVVTILPIRAIRDVIRTTRNK